MLKAKAMLARIIVLPTRPILNYNYNCKMCNMLIVQSTDGDAFKTFFFVLDAEITS